MRLNPLHVPVKELKGMYPFVLMKEEVPERWASLEPHVERAAKYTNGMITAKRLKHLLHSGHATCFGTIRDGEVILVAIAQMVDYETYRVGRVVACAGSEMRIASHWIDVLEVWAFSQGAIELEAWCRPVMVRMLGAFGWKPKTTIITRDLRRRLQ